MNRHRCRATIGVRKEVVRSASALHDESRALQDPKHRLAAHDGLFGTERKGDLDRAPLRPRGPPR